MSSPVDPLQNTTLPSQPPRRIRFIVHLLIAVLLMYVVIAYLVLPFGWRRYSKRHPALEGAPRIAHTASGIPGDPINLGLIGTEEELQRGMLAAKWYPADPITLKSSLRIAADTVFRREYVDAPVSSLFVWGHKQNLAFEQPVGDDPRRRHHVRFWRSDQLDDNGEPLWLGAATFDIKVGFSHTTGEITHHISPDVDDERDRIIADLQKIGALQDVEWIDGFQTSLTGKNGGGDPYHTDGRLAVGVLATPTKTDTPPAK